MKTDGLDSRSVMAVLKELCQAEACDAVVATLGSVIKSVEYFADNDYRERRATAQIIVGFIDTDFIICLVLFQNILRKCSIAANYLQNTNIDTSKAVELIDALRESELFEDIWQNATTLTNAHEIPVPPEIRRRRCRKDPNLHMWTKKDYKEKLFDKVVKVFVDELNKRFDNSVCDLLRSMASLIPSSSHFLDIDTLKPIFLKER